MRLPFFPNFRAEEIFDRDYSIMARLHVALPFERTSFRRFVYISDSVARDAAKEEEEAAKLRARMAARRG